MQAIPRGPYYGDITRATRQGYGTRECSPLYARLPQILKKIPIRHFSKRQPIRMIPTVADTARLDTFDCTVRACCLQGVRKKSFKHGQRPVTSERAKAQTHSQWYDCRTYLFAPLLCKIYRHNRRRRRRRRRRRKCRPRHRHGNRRRCKK